MANFKTIYTNYGLSALTAAQAKSALLNLTHMAVGDGNGNATTPDPAQTGLAREMFRAPVNRLYSDPVNPAQFTAELIVPANIGGFTLREVGLFDAGGSLFAVGNLPATYKPYDTEGTFADTVVRMQFVVANAGVVNVLADPNVAVATQSWIANNVTAETIIPGGTTGQVLRKHSNSNGDTEWADPTDVNVLVGLIEETQTLAAGQTVVTLSTATTAELTVYIDGLRLNRGATEDWTPDPDTPDTKIVLTHSYPDGTEILCVQNEPLGNVPYPLQRDLNLSDLANKALSRTNLDVYSKAEADQAAPVGTIAHFARSTAPAGWLKANGAAVSRTAYARLFAEIGTQFGSGDGFTTFNLPDLRGEFIRGWDDGRGIDAGRALNSLQLSAFGSHSHIATSEASDNHTHDGKTVDLAGAHSHEGSTNLAGAHQHVINAAGAHSHDSSWGSDKATPPYGYSTSYVRAGSGDTDYNNYGWYTSTDGAHAHSMNAAVDHSHSLVVRTGGEHTHPVKTDPAGSHTHAINVQTAGTAETRPRNIALLACIRF